jgi:hypothetical protein
MYHAIILDASLAADSDFLSQYEPFNIKVFPDSDWVVNGLEVKDSEGDEFVKKLQDAMQEGPWYNHLYNEAGMLIIVFKEKVFRMEGPEGIMEVWEYGEKLGIPEDQLQFEPVNFEEEGEYFSGN